jgi:glycerophosphoryl diester phosphodiesterase
VEPRFIRVGHGGAGALVRGNTIASFEAALELGVDMIEFDVRAHQGRLVLAHWPIDLHLRPCLRLDQALRHLSTGRFGDVHFNVDVKQPGCEAATLYALERFGLTDRALISSHLVSVVDRFRELDPSVKTGVSVGNRLLRRYQGWGDWREAVLGAIERKRFDAVMAMHRIIDAPLVEALRERNGEIYAWTVDDRKVIDRLRTLGVDGVVTNDPRLFLPAG